ncbi:hypothetical protein [Veillonella ratti]|uniref:hypothetical protein n=1 Tax=Veillonella ratti TaxID=103892 RepID=UPI000F8DDFF4|nr:hypothetical protein [Veillonella ratti]
MDKHEGIFVLLANAMHKVGDEESKTWFVANQFIKAFKTEEAAKVYLIDIHLAKLKNSDVNIGEVFESNAEDKEAFFKMNPIFTESDYVKLITVKNENAKSVIGFSIKEENT